MLCNVCLICRNYEQIARIHQTAVGAECNLLIDSADIVITILPFSSLLLIHRKSQTTLSSLW